MQFADGPRAAGDGALPLIEGHGNWDMELPTMAEVAAVFEAAPWANYKNWAVTLARRVLARADGQRTSPRL